MSSGDARIGQDAPDFTATTFMDSDFNENFKLSDYKGKYIILFFYPLDFTFVCPTEIIAFSDRAEEFSKLNCQVLACSTDSHFSHMAWSNVSRKNGGIGEMEIPIIADPSHEVAKKFGVLVPNKGITYRGLFIIDDKFKVRQIIINDLTVGRSVDEALRLVQAIQFVDAHGEACPVNWQPGDKGI